MDIRNFFERKKLVLSDKSNQGEDSKKLTRIELDKFFFARALNNVFKESLKMKIDVEI